MRITGLLIVLFFFMLSIHVFANEEQKPSYAPIFSINEGLLALAIESDSKQFNTINALQKLDYTPLNAAENYLYLMVKANNVEYTYEQAIDDLLQATALEPQINLDQLTSLPFLNVYKKLAHNYAESEQFKKAYDAKHLFIKKYDTFLKNERKKHIFELEDKYETNRKKNLNVLLNNQTELKALEISESLNNEVLQRRNIYVVSLLVVIFLLLLIRLFTMNKRINDLSKEDMLTGVCNRKTLFKYGQKNVKHCFDEQMPLCLLAINIDYFAQLNNAHGDYIGDEVLKKIALLGIESMRTRDVFSRLEGATFIAVLPGTSEGEAKAIAQHLKDKVAAFSFDYVGIHKQIKLSISIVELSDSLSNFELLLNTGMNILYEMRDMGGDKINVHPKYN